MYTLMCKDKLVCNIDNTTGEFMIFDKNIMPFNLFFIMKMVH